MFGFDEDRTECLRMLDCRLPILGGEYLSMRPQLNPTSFGCRKCRTGAIPDHLTLMLSKHSQHLNEQPVRLRHVGTANFDIGIEKLGDE